MDPVRPLLKAPKLRVENGQITFDEPTNCPTVRSCTWDDLREVLNAIPAVEVLCVESEHASAELLCPSELDPSQLDKKTVAIVSSESTRF